MVPAGDQPAAIAEMETRISSGAKDTVLLGATGTGKTATVAWLAEKLQRPTLVMLPNKTLAAQFANELREMLPKNAVEYFVSYYDYYQPEAYVPQTDTYIEKDSSINDEVDRLRHSATNSLLTRRDTIVVASVSCIYGLGTPQEYVDRMVKLTVGGTFDRDGLLRKLVGMQYTRNDLSFTRGTFRVRGDTIEVIPVYEEMAVRIEMFGDEIERLMTLHPLTGEVISEDDELYIFPATHYVAGPERMERAIAGIEAELAERLAELERSGKLLEAQRLGTAWVFAVHDGCGFAIALLVVVKLRRVWPRLTRGARDVNRRSPGIGAAVAVVACLVAGVLWSAGLAAAPAGYSLLSWHDALGALLGLAVIAHMVVRAKRLRRRDLAGRRQLLASTGIAAVALVAWRGQQPFQAVLALKGARRRFTGSYEAGSFAGKAFPSTSWVADHPSPIDPAAYGLRIEGLVARPLRLTLDELHGADELVATLDCTGGFYSTQRWSGVRLGRILELAGSDAGAGHVSVASVTGYRWSFAIDDARGLLLATHVGGAPLAHDHGAPVRLVVPGARGFEWVKWVTRIELRRAPDLGAPLSTVWSSFV